MSCAVRDQLRIDTREIAQRHPPLSSTTTVVRAIPRVVVVVV